MKAKFLIDEVYYEINLIYLKQLNDGVEISIESSNSINKILRETIMGNGKLWLDDIQYELSYSKADFVKMVNIYHLQKI